MGDNKAVYQNDDFTPPRDGLVLQLAVGVGALSFDMTTFLADVAANSASAFDKNQRHSIYLSLVSMGGDSYYNFSKTAKVLVPATTGQVTLVGYALPANLAQRVRIDRINDLFLNYVSKAGTPFLLVYPSSHVAIGYP